MKHMHQNTNGQLPSGAPQYCAGGRWTECKEGTSWVWSRDPSQEFARSVMCMDWQRDEKRCHGGEAGRNEQSYVTLCQHNGALKGH